MRHLDPRPTARLRRALAATTLLTALAGAAAPSTALAAEPYPRVQLVPRDQAVSDPSFAGFKKKLDAMIAARDAGALRAELAPQVLIAFGGESGPDAFFERWKPAEPTSKLWPLLAEILRLGSTVEKSEEGVTATYPYAYAAFPDDLDAFTSGVITGRGVKVREKADEAAPVVTQLDHDVVKVPDWKFDPETGTSPPWIEVELWNGKTGFVPKSMIRSPGDYRVGFTKQGGAWKLTYLVAGD
ncbi:MAG: SH3 domain-containing protein [Deltaproteobacteria bacterium]|nr:SH3 domain-containing protein [Deltaproteobacteria bacterium]